MAVSQSRRRWYSAWGSDNTWFSQLDFFSALADDIAMARQWSWGAQVSLFGFQE
jgi:hypothetical protein